MSKITLLLFGLCALALLSEKVAAKHTSSSSSSSSESSSCGKDSSSSSSSSESSESANCGHRNKHHKSHGHHKSEHGHNCNWKWDLDRMSHKEIEDLKDWGRSHGIAWIQMKSCNDFYKSQHGSCGGTGDIEGLCGAFDSSSQSDSSESKEGDGMKGALHAIRLFEEFKGSDSLHEAFRKLKSLCDYVDSAETNSDENKISNGKKCNRTDRSGCTQTQQPHQAQSQQPPKQH